MYVIVRLTPLKEWKSFFSESGKNKIQKCHNQGRETREGGKRERVKEGGKEGRWEGRKEGSRGSNLH